MKKLPIGVQDFRKLIKDNYIYVDKTKYLYDILESGSVYFLSRPRRFGKSLTVSTFEYLFKGEKELFEGTYISDKWDFTKTYPVISISMSGRTTSNLKSFKESILLTIRQLYKKYGFEQETNLIPESFRYLVRQLSQKGRVVILIDEYDKPILDNIENPEKAENIRNFLRNFYSTFKDLDKYLKFVFITGISKFSKVGIFSGLNNLKDLTLKSDMSTALGYTKPDILKYFKEKIQKTKKELGLNEKEFWNKLENWYNGYSWNGREFVYNPFSILNFFDEYNFSNYWFESGTPSFLISYLKDKKLDLIDLKIDVDLDYFSSYEIEVAPPQSFLFQAGYLTIKNKNEDAYTLNFPNQEVKKSFTKHFLDAKYELDLLKSKPIRTNILKSYRENNVEAMIAEYKRAFSSIPYNLFIKKESYYHSAIICLLWATGIDAKYEEMTSKGRSDIIIEKKDRVFIFELKNGKPEKAIKQIKDKAYAEKYDKKVILIGLQIDFEKRNIVDFKIE